MTYTSSGATVHLFFGNYTTEDGVTVAIDLVPFTPAVNPEVFWGLQALNSTVFQQSTSNRADTRLVCITNLSAETVDENNTVANQAC